MVVSACVSTKPQELHPATRDEEKNRRFPVLHRNEEVEKNIKNLQTKGPVKKKMK